MQETTKQLYIDFPTGASYQDIDMIMQGSSSNTDLLFIINNISQGTATISPATWYYHRTMILGTAVQFITYTDSGWSNVLLNKSDTSSLSSARYPSFFAFYSDSSGCKMDFIYIKNYSSPEPTTSVGNEYTMPIRIR